MENIAPKEIVLTDMERKILGEIIEEVMSTEVIETCEKITEEANLETGKGAPKQLKPREEITEMTNDHHMKKTNTKGISEQQNKGFLMAIQNHHRKRSVRRILETFSVPRARIYQRPLKGATEEKVTAIILRWILDNLSAGESVLMRSRDYDGDIFELTIYKYRRCFYAKGIRRCRNAKRLYRWRKKITYDDLTIEEIEKSVRRAEKKDRKNRL